MAHRQVTTIPWKGQIDREICGYQVCTVPGYGRLHKYFTRESLTLVNEACEAVAQ